MKRLPQHHIDADSLRFYASSSLLLARWLNVSEARRLLASRGGQEALAEAEAELREDTNSLLATGR